MVWIRQMCKILSLPMFTNNWKLDNIKHCNEYPSQFWPDRSRFNVFLNTLGIFTIHLTQAINSPIIVRIKKEKTEISKITHTKKLTTTCCACMHPIFKMSEHIQFVVCGWKNKCLIGSDRSCSWLNWKVRQSWINKLGAGFDYI